MICHNQNTMGKMCYCFNLNHGKSNLSLKHVCDCNPKGYEEVSRFEEWVDVVDGN